MSASGDAFGDFVWSFLKMFISFGADERTNKVIGQNKSLETDIKNMHEVSDKALHALPYALEKITPRDPKKVTSEQIHDWWEKTLKIPEVQQGVDQCFNALELDLEAHRMLTNMQNDQIEIVAQREKLAKCMKIPTLDDHWPTGCNASLASKRRVNLNFQNKIRRTNYRDEYVAYNSEYYSDFEGMYFTSVMAGSESTCAYKCSAYHHDQLTGYRKLGKFGKEGCVEFMNDCKKRGATEQAAKRQYDTCMENVKKYPGLVVREDTFHIATCSVALFMPSTYKCRILTAPHGIPGDLDHTPHSNRIRINRTANNMPVTILEKFEACPCSHDEMQEINEANLQITNKLKRDNDDRACARAIGKKNLAKCGNFLHIPLNAKNGLCFGLGIGQTILQMAGNPLMVAALAETGYPALIAPVMESGVCLSSNIPESYDAFVKKMISIGGGQAKGGILSFLRNLLGEGTDKLIDLFSNAIEKGMEGRMDPAKAKSISDETNDILKGVLGRSLELVWEMVKSFVDFGCGKPVSAILDFIMPVIKCHAGCQTARCVFGPVPYTDKAADKPTEEDDRAFFDTEDVDKQICTCGRNWHQGKFMADYDSLKCKELLAKK